jgi:hypothetical protein
MDGLVENGLVPAGNTNTINPADRALFNHINGVTVSPGTWAYPTTMQGLAESGLVPSGTKTNTINPADRGHLNRARDAWVSSLDPADLAHLNRATDPR